MAKSKAITTAQPPSSGPKSERSRREAAVPTSEQATSSYSLFNAAATFAEAMADAHHEAQKQYRAAWQSYLHSVQVALDPDAVREAAHAFSAGVQKSIANQDSREYLETARQFSTAAQQAQEKAQTRVKDAYTKWIDEAQQAYAKNSGTLKAEFENYLKALQAAFSQADASQVDAATLARIGQATLAAALLRVHLH